MKKVELLFPELCNIYGESYNVEYLRRCSDEIEVINTNHMDTPAFVNEDVDMIYLGCTTERKQEQIIGILSQYRDRIIELIDKGVITEDEAEHHEQKNVITKALGTEHRADPDFYKVDLESNDILLLCSDGLYGEVPAEKIAQILKTDQNMNDMCASLVQEALAAGGRDNITVICLKI